MSSFKEEISKRRTFAIISHPDAGKTTLTEKLLLYGGAINLAGSVKGKRTAKHAVSDWMEIEKQRGISVTSSVLQFKYNGYCINILDTPGQGLLVSFFISKTSYRYIFPEAACLINNLALNTLYRSTSPLSS